MKKALLYILILIGLSSSAQSLYFPPLVGKTWDTLSPVGLGWCVSKTDSLYNYLGSKNTKGFIVLKDGKIVLEKYFGIFTQDSFWYWASAGKTMSAVMVGVAQQKKLLSIEDTSSKYLGKGWTNEPAIKEDQIKVLNQLSMTTGLDDNGINKDCTFDSCLVYKADAGARWAYHNAPYTLLDKVVETASGQTWQQFFNAEIRNKTAINGLWVKAEFNNVLYSNARSMARFGLLLLNKGKWDQTDILADTSYFRKMTNSSQSINPGYGYLTWLNGTEKFMAPGSQIVFPGMLSPNAPADMYAAMGKNGQLINVVPSMNLVMLRIGDAPGDNGEVPISFNNEIWLYLNKVICNGSNFLSEPIEDVKVSIYPNPAQTSFEINGLLARDIMEIGVYDLHGKQQLSSTNILEVDISNLPPAFYLVKIRTNRGILVKKIVKNL
jgi:CubicO group peptidase (beta-lactamase class C family)